MDILLVDDEQRILNAVQRELRAYNANIVAVDQPEKALWWLDSRSFDLVISDYRMPRLSGVQVLRKAADTQPDAVRVMLSGYTDVEAMLVAVNEIGLLRYILKPWPGQALHELMCKVTQILQARPAVDDAPDSKDEHHSLLAELEATQPGLTKVEFSPTGTIVL